jgi:hypothetical protein
VRQRNCITLSDVLELHARQAYDMQITARDGSLSSMVVLNTQQIRNAVDKI